MTPPTLHTDRLTLRAFSLDDWEDYAAAWADARMTAFIGGQPRDRTTSWAKFTAIAGMWSLIGYGYWSFVDRASGACVGHGGLARHERGLAALEGVPEAGWAFVPDAWGLGYATEAMAAVLRWSDAARLGETRCIIDPGNAPSMNVARKLGFEQIGEVDFPPGRTTVWRRSLS
jgi:RimJ/RimL family protein N-acetyltransferase